jgi:hypothetical protein
MVANDALPCRRPKSHRADNGLFKRSHQAEAVSTKTPASSALIELRDHWCPALTEWLGTVTILAVADLATFFQCRVDAPMYQNLEDYPNISFLILRAFLRRVWAFDNVIFGSIILRQSLTNSVEG